MTFGSFANAGNGKESTSQDGGAPVSQAKNADVVNEVNNVNEVVKEVAKEVVEEVVREAVNEAVGEVVREDVQPNEVSNEALAVKISFGNDIRRASFTPGTSFAALCELVAKLFGVGMPVVLKYQDNEGDKITVSSDDELQEAVRLAQDTQKMVRIFVDTKPPHAGTPAQVQVAQVTQVAQVPQVPCPGGWRHPTPHLFRGEPLGMGPNMPPFYSVMHTNSFGTFSPSTHTAQNFVAGPLRSSPHHPSPAAPTTPAAPTASFGLPLFSHGAFSPASDALPIVRKDDAAERMRMDQERRVFKARKNAMKEALKAMKANAVTQEDKEAITEFKAKMRAELKEAWKGFKQQKKSKRDGIVGKYVCDVTIADNSELAPNTSCVKTWRVRNDGTAAWPAGCQLILSANHSDKLDAPERVVLECPVLPQEEVAVSVPFTAPTDAGRYVAYFRLATPDGSKFGQRLWMSFVIPSGSAAKLEKSEKSEKLIDDTFEETPCPPAQDPSSDFVVLSNLGLD